MSVRVCTALDAAGPLSIAEARTSLLGWLFARHEGGAFSLRIEGTGPQGGMPKDAQATGDRLHWLGLDWDEEPELSPKPERLALYQRYARNATPAGSASLDTEGHPAPLLAHVVDQHEMAITHVFRDARALPHTQRELALYRALGWEPPRYVHLPAIKGPDLESLDTYRERGYLALALANQLARLGWSPRGKRELLSMEALAARFDLQRISRATARFDPKQLNWFNRRCLRALGEDEVTDLLVPYWRRAYGAADRSAGTALTPRQWQRTLALVIREELDCLDQAAERARFAFVDQVAQDEQSRQALGQPYAAEVLDAFVRGLPDVEPFVYEALDAYISALRLRFKASLGIRSREVMYVIRAALSGQQGGPCLVEVCQLLGRDRCIERVRAATAPLSPHPPARHTARPPCPRKP
jgi:glutamyl/glutaminyl-tRNA synthetase